LASTDPESRRVFACCVIAFEARSRGFVPTANAPAYVLLAESRKARLDPLSLIPFSRSDRPSFMQHAKDARLADAVVGHQLGRPEPNSVLSHDLLDHVGPESVLELVDAGRWSRIVLVIDRIITDCGGHRQCTSELTVVRVPSQQAHQSLRRAATMPRSEG